MPTTISGTATSFITFSRASTATRVNASGLIETVSANTPRLDYDPVTLAPRGLLVEEQRTNLLTESDFRNGLTDAPTRTGSALLTATSFYSYLANTSLAFGWDGTTTVFAYKNYTPAASTVMTMSVFVRMDDGNAPSFGSAASGASTNDFVLNVGGSFIAPNTYAVQNMGNNIYRVTGTFTTGAAPNTNTGVVKYGSNSNRTFRVTGYQLEQASFATSYIPTLAASATRSADVASVATSSFPYNADESTLVANVSLVGYLPGSTQAFVGLSVTTNDVLYLGSQSSNGTQTSAYSNAVTRTAGTSVSFITTNSQHALNTPYKVAAAFKQDDYAASVSGGTVGTDTLGAMPAAATLLNIGNFVTTANYLNGHIRQITYIPRRLTNAELQTRST